MNEPLPAPLALRKALGMTQRALAKEFMVTHVSIGLWERGLRTIPGPVLRLMAMFEEKMPAKSDKD